MVNLTKSTKSISNKEVKRDWHIVDVKGKILGRLAPDIAKFLQGKHKVNYVSYIDMGDYVVVINAKYVKLTGRKEGTKIYTRYSGYPGGLKQITFSELIIKRPTEIIKHAVSGMIPKNKHRDNRLARLYIFSDENHSFKNKFKS